nr:MAG TPA: hypothetical protein [Caudoviricetes sp.]
MCPNLPPGNSCEGRTPPRNRGLFLAQKWMEDG